MNRPESSTLRDTVTLTPLPSGRAVFALRDWRVLFLAAAIAALYFDVVGPLFMDWWENESYSHGLIAAPLALYVGWRQRKDWLAVPPSPSAYGIFGVGLACVLYVAGKAGAEFFLTRISLLVLIVGLMWTFRGIGLVRAAWFPLLLFASVIPLPVLLYNRLAAPLQLLASGLSTRVVQWLGISVFQDGNVIYLASASLGVAEACSGLRSLASLIAAALLLGYLDCGRTVTRLLLLFMAFPIAILFNIVRVTGTAILAEEDPEFAMGFYHSISGWLIFLFGFGALFLTSRLMRRSSRPVN